MGRRGPAAKPTAAHERAGTYRADRHAGGVRVGQGRIPRPPAGLSKSALAAWRYLAPILADLDLLSNRFRDALALYCETWAEYWQHKKTLAKEGYTTQAGNKTTIPHPCVGMKDRCQSQLVKLARELGLTPAAATGLTLTQEEVEGDPLDEMERQGRPSLKVTSEAS